MKTILEKSRYLAIVGVVSLLLASVAAFAWSWPFARALSRSNALLM